MIQDLQYAIVYVDDMNLQTAFYRDTLGLPPGYAVEGWTQFATRGAALVLHPKVHGQDAAGSRVHLSFNVDNLEDEYRALVARGAKFAAPPATASFGKHATLFDPEGNPIDLLEWARPALVTRDTVVNDLVVNKPETMEVLEEHSIRICGGCIVLLNSPVSQAAEYTGLGAEETAVLVEELNDKIHST